MRTSLLPFLALLAACAAPPATGAPPATPAGPAPLVPAPVSSPQVAASPPPVDPFVPAAPLGEESFPSEAPPAFDARLVLPPVTAGAGAPRECRAYVDRRATGDAACDAQPAALEALDLALSKDGDARDAALAALERCAGLPAGLVRALRIDLAPLACGDALAAPVLAKAPKGLGGDVQQVLFGQALAARLSRLAEGAPTLGGEADKKHVLAFIKGPLASWMTKQATAVQELSSAGVTLSGYARAVAATEAGITEMRLVDAVRAVPVPKEIAADEELRSVYYASLDEALEPRKARGRDAALVGLRDFAVLGSLRDARVERARALLSKLYGGRRIDALDALLLPPLSPAPGDTAVLRLAARLPTFYAGVLLDPAQAKEPAMLRALLERGLPTSTRRGLRGVALAPEAARLAARARLGLGERYWRAVDFDEAAALLAPLPPAQRGDDGALLLGLALALRGGPLDAAAMMRDAPVLVTGMGRTAALDSMGGGPLAGLAAFDAAVVKQVALPAGAKAEVFVELAHRYEKAAGALTDPAQRAEAAARARAAEELAAAVR